MDGRYLRRRLGAALSSVLMVVLMSYAVAHLQLERIGQHARTADALNRAMVSVVEHLVLLEDIADLFDQAADDAINADFLVQTKRSELRRAIPALEAAIADLEGSVERGWASQDSLALIEMLNPVVHLKAIVSDAELVAGGDGRGGQAPAAQAASAGDTAMLVLPIVRGVKEAEEAQLLRIRMVKEGTSMAVTVLVALLLGAIWVGLFRPLERRVVAAQEAQAEGRRTAEAASRAKSSFIATMSHEIRTPLTGVLGMADLMVETPLDAEQSRMLATISGSGRTLLAIVDDVLDLSRAEAGRIDIASEPLDAAALVGDVAALFEGQARARGTTMRAEVMGEPAARHIGDPVRLRQVLSNLVSNAVKFTEDGSVTLRLEAIAARRGRQRLIFSVIDTGIGMDEGQLGAVWEAFEQADASAARRHGGAGLGLPISRRLTEAMGGRLAARSAPGEGSTFTLEMPMEVAPAEVEDAPAQEAPRAVKGAREGEAPVVLLADDTAVNRTIAERMLTRAGCEVLLAADGAEAVAAWEHGRPDLILMDVSMPGMDGLQATRAIREAERLGGRARVPISALSAHVGPEHRARCLDAGMDRVMSKPFKRADLEGAIAELVPGRRGAPGREAPGVLEGAAPAGALGS